MHSSKSVAGKEWKSIRFYRSWYSTASMLMVDLLHVLKFAAGRLLKSCKNTTQNEVYLIIGIIAPWNRSTLDSTPPPMCDKCSHWSQVRWNRSAFEMDSEFCAVGVANAASSQYHFMCLKWAEFFLSGWQFLLLKVRVCAILCNSANNCTVILIHKVTVSKMPFRLSGRSP